MKTKVIEFLKALGELSPEEQFNQALLHYQKSPTPNPGIIRSHNVQGYSKQRLNELLYDLKQAYGITVADLAVPATSKNKTKVKQLNPEDKLPEGFPEFSKGATGNAERKAYLKANNLTSENFKSATMDQVIINHLKSLAEATVDEQLVLDIKETLSKNELISDELMKRILASNEATKSQIEEIKKAFEDDLNQRIEIGLERFQKVQDLIKSGEELPASLIKEIYENAEMTDGEALDIILEAKNSLSAESAGTNPDANGTETAKSGTDIPENGTDVSKSETEVSKNETPEADSEKK